MQTSITIGLNEYSNYVSYTITQRDTLLHNLPNFRLLVDNDNRIPDTFYMYENSFKRI